MVLNIRQCKCFFSYTSNKSECVKQCYFFFVFQIISAQQLPKINTDKFSSIVDPQVWVEIHGVAIDNTKGKTQRIDNNGKSDFITISKSDSLTSLFQQRAFYSSQ